MLVDVFGGVPAKDVVELAKERDPLVAAKLAWALGRQPATPETDRVLLQLTAHATPAVRRSAWEAVMRRPDLAAGAVAVSVAVGSWTFLFG